MPPASPEARLATPLARSSRSRSTSRRVASSRPAALRRMVTMTTTTMARKLRHSPRSAAQESPEGRTPGSVNPAPSSALIRRPCAHAVSTSLPERTRPT